MGERVGGGLACPLLVPQAGRLVPTYHPAALHHARAHAHPRVLRPLAHPGGAIHPDQRRNRQVYGEGWTVDDVLRGRVEAPAEFKPLYKALHLLTAKSQQEVARL